MAKAVNDAQSQYLATLVAGQTTVWVFLVTGIRLVGTIVSFDRYMIALQAIGGMQVIYKNAISTITEPFVLPGSSADDRNSGRGKARVPRNNRPQIK